MKTRAKNPLNSSLMKSISKTPRHSADRDRLLAEKRKSLLDEMMQLVYAHESLRSAIAEVGHQCIRNEISQTHFVVNLGANRQEDSKDGYKNDALTKIIAALEVNDKTFLNKYVFSIECLRFAADSVALIDANASRSLAHLIAKYIEVRNELCLPHMRLAHFIAKEFLSRASIHDLEDLASVGFEGLLKAADRFDPALGSFGTYAANWVRQVISRHIIDTGSLVRHPVHLAETMQRVQTAASQIEAATGETPSIDQIAVMLDLPPEKVIKAQAAYYSTISLDSPLSDETNQTYFDRIQDPSSPDPEAETSSTQIKKIVDDLIKTSLDERSQMVIRLRFGLTPDGEEYSAEAVGAILGRSRARVQQIEEKAKELMRARKISRHL